MWYYKALQMYSHTLNILSQNYKLQYVTLELCIIGQSKKEETVVCICIFFYVTFGQGEEHLETAMAVDRHQHTSRSR